MPSHLFVVRSLSLIILKHICDEFIRRITLHLSETHGSDLDATGTNDAGNPGVHKCCISSLCLWAGDSTMASTVVMQKLRREIAASHGDGGPSRNIAINQESGILAKGPKLREHILSTGNHLCWIICGDVSRKQFRLTSLFDASTHGFDNFWNALVHLTKDLISLWFIVFDEVSTWTECAAGLAERFWLQAQLWFNDGAHHQSSIFCQM